MTGRRLTGGEPRRTYGALRQRIFTASRAGDLKKVRNLQKLMLRSRANTLLSVRRVTEVNAGRKTAGVDGRVVLLSSDKAGLAEWLQRNTDPWAARPVRRVFIPKANGKKLRPLGIPVIVDRAQQARVLNALEPEWEARFEPRSYGFRPGRGCHDAIAAIYAMVKGSDTKRGWVLDADLAAAFDHIDHDHLLRQLGGFPARDAVGQWLKAGVMDRGRFTPTEEGNSSRRRDQPVADERCLARNGRGCRSPVPATRPASGQGEAGFTGADQIRRRPGGPVSQPVTRPNKPRRGWPHGWPREAWPSTRKRRESSLSPRASTSWGSTSASTAASC